MVPFALTVFAWQRAQSGNATPAWAEVLGGLPWHDPQNACDVPAVHTGVRSLKAVSVARFVPPPWQYVLEHEAPFQVGFAPLASASPEKITSAGRLSMCPGLSTAAGTW